MTSRVVKLAPPSTNDDAVLLLEGLLERARSGEILQVCAVSETRSGYGTVSSYAKDRRIVSAMLIELGVRGLLVE